MKCWNCQTEMEEVEDEDRHRTFDKCPECGATTGLGDEPEKPEKPGKAEKAEENKEEITQ